MFAWARRANGGPIAFLSSAMSRNTQVAQASRHNVHLQWRRSHFFVQTLPPRGHLI